MTIDMMAKEEDSRVDEVVIEDVTTSLLTEATRFRATAARADSEAPSTMRDRSACRAVSAAWKSSI